MSALPPKADIDARTATASPHSKLGSRTMIICFFGRNHADPLVVLPWRV
jgi:hypothetical protein